jgi:hypothetical protein
MSLPTLCTPIDNAETFLTSGYTAGSGTMTVANGSVFGIPSIANPVRVVAISGNAHLNYIITNVSGNVLTVQIHDGYSDVNLPASTILGVIIAAGTVSDIHAYLTAGIQGPQGSQGNQGTQGSQGTQGRQGTAGSQGSNGSNGATGSQGPQGYQGQNGSNGATGSQGPQGYQGYQGQTGTGTQGPQGSSGGGSGGSPGGNNTDVQYNDGGILGGTDNLTWNGSQLLVTGTNGFGSIACNNPNTSGSKRAGFTIQGNGNVYWFVAMDLASNGTTDFFIYDTQVRFYISSGNGKVGIGTSSPGGQLHTLIGNSTYVGQIVQAASGQTADLHQFQNSSGTVLSGVDPNGYVRTAATSGAPTTSPATGSMAFDSSANKLWVFNGTSWKGVTLS